jgi:outer membrane protein
MGFAGMKGTLGFLGPVMIVAWASGCAWLKAPEAPNVVDLYLAHPYPLATPRVQQVPEGPVTLQQAVEIALSNYPSIRAARARAEAASAGIDLANTAYLPRIDLLWQEIRATRNNYAGTILPNPVIPGLSGPVAATTSWNSTWGSAGGALFSIEPFDFGYRSASVDVTRAATKQAHAQVEVTRLEAGTNAAEAFLAVLASQETFRTAQSNVERWTVFAQTVHVLAGQQLRPGADASRADAELARAQIQLTQVKQIVDNARATLREALGFGEGTVAIDPGPLLKVPFRTEVPAIDPSDHPLSQSQRAAVEVVRARAKTLESAYYPKFFLQFLGNGRGTGFDSTGKTLDGDEGLLPDRANWEAGLIVTFPLMDYFQLKARSAIEGGNEQAERSRLDQIVLGLKLEEAKVRSALEAAVGVSEKTPVQLKAAQDAEMQSTTRYQNGLGTISEVAEARQLLARAEIDDTVARLAIWRVLSQASRVQGDIAPFLQVVEQTPR